MPDSIIQGRRLADELRQDDAVFARTGKSVASGHSLGTFTQGINETEMSAPFTIVTNPAGSRQNRNGNIVRITQSKEGRGMMIDQYANNPVVLLDHGFQVSVPVGLSAPDQGAGPLSLKLQKTKATATGYFTKSIQESENTFAAIASGLLRMASIGFRAIKAIRLMSNPERRDRDDGVRDFESSNRFWEMVETELLEWSVVGIGADRGALRQTLERGSIHDSKLCEPVRLFMQQHAETAPTIGVGMPEFGETEGGIAVPEHIAAPLRQAVDAAGGWDEFGDLINQAAAGRLAGGESDATDPPAEAQNAADDATSGDVEAETAQAADVEADGGNQVIAEEQSADSRNEPAETPAERAVVAVPQQEQAATFDAQAVADALLQSARQRAPEEPVVAIQRAIRQRLDDQLTPLRAEVQSLRDQLSYLRGE